MCNSKFLAVDNSLWHTSHVNLTRPVSWTFKCWCRLVTDLWQILQVVFLFLYLFSQVGSKSSSSVNCASPSLSSFKSLFLNSSWHSNLMSASNSPTSEEKGANIELTSFLFHRLVPTNVGVLYISSKQGTIFIFFFSNLTTGLRNSTVSFFFLCVASNT